MLFNPFKYQYEATYLRDEGDSAVLQLRRGTEEDTLAFPKKLLAPEIQPGDVFILNLQSQESIHQTEADTLKKLLEELIR